ncbi:exodeoxyribonuclease V subunit gamma [Ferrimonas senticii]|uniref:exodeoxyribonuclease V subunit gamma n=1 Tax=Ferrimonas senticii TaxID=394566 RepID=UPI00041DA6AD|nr:exodeoxyribonuclease V subunit gamma [Ferrimonas senticii]
MYCDYAVLATKYAVVLAPLADAYWAANLVNKFSLLWVLSSSCLWPNNKGEILANQLLPPAAAPLTNGLMMLHSNQIEQLRELVVQWLAQYPLAPLEPEIFLVQSNGMAQWLKLALAADDGHGIACNLQMQMPSRFIWQLYRCVLGEAVVPKQSPFDKPQLRWRLLRMLPSLVDRPDFESLKRFLSGDQPTRKRDQLAEQLADLYDQYQVYRGDWLQHWAAGDDVIVSGHGVRSPLPLKQLWQAQLWRAILADMTAAERETSRAELHQRFIDTLARGAVPARLPRRLVVFGISALPKQSIEVLAALAEHCQVLLCINNPCQHFWGDIVEDKDLLKRQLQNARHQRKAGLPEVLDEDQQHNHVNPLLAAWGKQGRDYIGMLYEYDQPELYQGNFQQIDLFAEPEGDSLLTQLQRGIFDLAPLPSEPSVVADDDDSLQLVLAHSRQREVEILHDQLLKRFADNPQLQPADVIVMMPDVSQYAPYIEAVFGRFDPSDSRYLPFTIADRPQRGHQVMLLALETLFGLSSARFAVSELLDLLAVPALRARFEIAEADLPLLQRWIEQAGIRWGLHGEQRHSLNLPEALEQNTWSFGLKRMLLGYAVGDGQVWHGIEPCEEIGGLDAALVGKLAALVDTLEGIWRFYSQHWHPAQWAEGLGHALDALFCAQDDIEASILTTLKETLAQWQIACSDAGVVEALPITVLKEVCLAPFEGEGVSQRFLAGRVNFCTLMPMRAIPFAQVCLLGMNDEDYPRSRPPLDFDLMAMAGQLDGAGNRIPSQYRTGDRSRREDDRYLFLEALLAARQWLYLSYVGHNARDNAERTPSVLLGQLLDHIRAGYCAADGSDIISAITQSHPLQPFSRRYFDGSGLQSFALEWQQIHQPLAPVEPQPLPPWQPQSSLNLQDLAALMRDPAKLFLGRRLGIWLDDEAALANDLEPFAFDALEHHLLRQQLFSALAEQSHDANLEQTVAAQFDRWQGRGQLPIGGFAKIATQGLSAPVLSAFEQALRLAGSWQPVPAREVKFSHNDLAIEDWLTGLLTDGQHCYQLLVLPKKLADSQRLKKPLDARLLWLQHVAANSQYQAEQQQVTSFLVAADGIWRFEPLAAADARGYLIQLLQSYRDGMAQPLALAPAAGIAWLAEMAKSNDADKALRAATNAFEGDNRLAGDLGYSPYQSRCWQRFSQLLEHGFESNCKLLYQPLLEAAQWQD